MEWLLGLALIWAGSAWGFSCKSVLSTAYGPNEVLTAVYHAKDGIVWLEDGVTYVEGEPQKNFNYTPESLPLWTHGGVKAFGAQPDAQRGNYLFVLDGAGVLRLATPDRLLFGVNPPNNETIGAASLFQPPFRDLERELVPMRDLRFANPGPESLRQQREAQQILEGAPLPTFLYAAVGNRIYRGAVTPVEVDSTSDLGRALLNGPIRLTKHEAIPGMPAHLEVETLEANVIDWTKSGSDTHIYIPTATEGRAYEVKPLERALTIVDEKVMNRIDFMQALSRDQILVGSEIGQVIVVNSKTKAVEEDLRVDGAAWITGLAGYQLPNERVVWAINRGALVRWSSQDATNTLKILPVQLPDGEIPASIAAAGQAASIKTTRGPQGGYFSNVRSTGDEIAVERVFVQAKSGQLYGWREKPSIKSLTSEYEWELIPTGP